LAGLSPYKASLDLRADMKRLRRFTVPVEWPEQLFSSCTLVSVSMRAQLVGIR
jgi:hypothetical protein